MRKKISVGGPSDAHLEDFCRLAAAHESPSRVTRHSPTPFTKKAPVVRVVAKSSDSLVISLRSHCSGHCGLLNCPRIAVLDLTRSHSPHCHQRWLCEPQHRSNSGVALAVATAHRRSFSARFLGNAGRHLQEQFTPQQMSEIAA